MMAEYIDRQKAIEVCDWYEHEFVECEYAIRLVAEELKKLPSADVEPVRRGRWILGNEMPDFPRVPYKPWMRYCSCCGEMTGQDDNALYSFCPNCGARMDGDIDG